MKLTPKSIIKLVEISFCIEPLLDKKDCSTRFVDLPGKSIYDFIIAGINVGEVFEDYAKKELKRKDGEIFSHFPEAVKVSNFYKSKKTINVGLLEFMFLTLKTRLNSRNLKEATNGFIKTAKNTTNKDVKNILKAYKIATKTSTNPEKIKNWKSFNNYTEVDNIYVLMKLIHKKIADKRTSHNQVTGQYLTGFPIIKTFINEIDEEKGLIKSLKDSYNKIHKNSPEIKIGILAGLSAAAMFLYLIFQDPKKYILR